MLKIEELQEEFLVFTKIDDFNMDDRLKRIPAFKHSWISRLIDAKRERFSLLKVKRKTKEALTKRMIEEGVVQLTKQTLDSLENTDKMEEINDNIQEIDLLIEYLEFIVKNVSFIGNDWKLVIEHKKLELE